MVFTYVSCIVLLSSACFSPVGLPGNPGHPDLPDLPVLPGLPGLPDHLVLPVHPDHAAGYYIYGMKKGAEAYSLVIPRHRGDSHLYTSTPSIVPRVGLEPTRPFRARRF